MRPDKFSLAKAWINDERSTPEEARATWNAMDQEFNENRKIFLASAESDALKDAINKKFGPGTIKYGSEIPQPAQRDDVIQIDLINAFMKRNPAAEGGQMVKPSVDGSRPGYKGPKKDSSVIAKKIDEVNKGFKFYTYDQLAKELPGFNSGSNLQIYIKNNNLSKLESFPKKVEKAWISLFEDGNKSAKTVYKPLVKIRELVGGGQKDYGTGTTKRNRTEHISKALKESDLLVWEDIKPLINRLSNQNFINSLNRKGGDYTITDVEYSTYNKSGMLRAPKTDAEHLMDYVIRHVDQSDSPVYSIYDSKTNKRITNLNNVDSYHDIYFKSESPFQDNTKYDMDYLKTKARQDPLFKEYFDLQDELFKMKNKEYWPDGSRIIDPKTGKGTTFGKWSGNLYKEGYGYTKSFERFPYDTDHKFGVGKHPFKDLAILPQRINIALGSVKQKNRGDLSKKIGANYFRNLSVDDLMMQEKDFGKKILIFDKDGNHIGKKLETPYQNAKRMVKYYNELDLFNANKGPQPEFPLSDFQKPNQAVPIEKRLEIFKNEPSEWKEIIKAVGCPVKGKAEGGRIGFDNGGDVDCFDKGQKLINNGMKGASPAQLKNLARLGPALLKAGSAVMSGLIVPEALIVGLETAARVGYGDTPSEAILRATDYLTPNSFFGDFMQKADLMKIERILGKDVKNIAAQSFDRTNQSDKINSLEEKLKNLEAMSESGDFGYIGDLTNQINMTKNQIKKEKEDLKNKFTTTGQESKDFYTKQAFDNAYDASIAKSKSAEKRLVDSQSENPRLSATQEMQDMKSQEALNKGLSIRSPLTGSKGETAFLNLSQLPLGPRRGSDMDVLAEAMNDERMDADYLRAMQDYKQMWKDKSIEEMIDEGVPLEAILGFNIAQPVETEGPGYYSNYKPLNRFGSQERPVLYPEGRGKLSEGGITALRSKYEYKK